MLGAANTYSRGRLGLCSLRIRTPPYTRINGAFIPPPRQIPKSQDISGSLGVKDFSTSSTDNSSEQTPENLRRRATLSASLLQCLVSVQALWRRLLNCTLLFPSSRAITLQDITRVRYIHICSSLLAEIIIELTIVQCQHACQQSAIGSAKSTKTDVKQRRWHARKICGLLWANASPPSIQGMLLHNK